MNSNDNMPKYTIRQLREAREYTEYRLVYEMFTSVIELSLLIGCFYGFLMLLVEYR